ncbi:hypothetical protein BDAP_001582 [Binucleata daphniae]
METKIRRMKTKDDVYNIRRLIDLGKSNSEIALSLNFSVNTIKNIVQKLQYDFYLYIKSFQTQGERRSQKKKDKNYIKTELINQIACDNTITQKLIVHKLAETGINTTQRKLSRVLLEIEYTRKRLSKIPNRRNTPAAILGRQSYAHNNRMIADENFVFINKTVFKLHKSVHYGYL